MNALLSLSELVAEERAMLRRNWGWFVALGVALVALGVAGLVFVGLTTLVAVVFIGWMFLLGGTLEVAHAIARKGWQGFWLDLVSGAIFAVTGVLILLRPAVGAAMMTMLIGVLFLVGGIFRLGTGIAIKNPYRGWFLLHGAVSLLLGIMVLAGWPESAVWVIGTFVAIDLLLEGLQMISLGLAARKFPAIGHEEPSPRTAPATPAA